VEHLLHRLYYVHAPVKQLTLIL